MEGGQRYWAFLSYSHKDRTAAQRLHHALESYAMPARLVGRMTPVGTVPKRLRPVFKDRDDLPADGDLSERVDAAIRASSALVVICSPDAARSSWVEGEIVRFKAVWGDRRVFPVIVAGEPGGASASAPGEECFPLALRFKADADGVLTREGVEPVAADLRPGGDGRRRAMLKLIAGILGLELDELVQRDAQRQVRRMAAVVAAVLVALVVTGALAIAAIVAGNEARAQRAKAESLVEFMLGNLRNKLEPTGRLDLLGAVGAEALAYYDSQAGAGLDDEALGRQARVLQLMGDLSDRRGDLSAASRDFERAAAMTARLLARKPDDTSRIFNHSQSVYYLGYMADRRGEERRAEAYYDQYKALAERLIRLEPDRDRWRKEVAYANGYLGEFLLKMGRGAEATRAFSEALRVDLDLARKRPEGAGRQEDVAADYGWLGDAAVAEGQLDAAMRYRLAERGILTGLLDRAPGDNTVAEDMVLNATAVGDIALRQRQMGDAVLELEDAANESERLIGLSPDNTTYRSERTLALEMLARALLAQGRTTQAAPRIEAAARLAEDLVRTDPAIEDWNGGLLGQARILRIRLAQARADGRAGRVEALAPAVAEAARLAPFARAHPSNLPLARAAAEASLLAGDYHDLIGARDQANLDWTRAGQILTAAGIGAGRAAGGPSEQLLRDARTRLARRAG